MFLYGGNDFFFFFCMEVREQMEMHFKSRRLMMEQKLRIPILEEIQLRVSV